MFEHHSDLVTNYSVPSEQSLLQTKCDLPDNN